MFRKKPVVEWEFLAEEEQDEPWPPVPQEPEGYSEPGTHLRLRRAILFSVVVSILLVAGVSVAYARKEALKGIQAIERDVQTAVEVEEWVQQNTSDLFADILADDDPLSYWAWTVGQERRLVDTEMGGTGSAPELYIHDIRFSIGIAAAELTLTQSAPGYAAPAVYRQTRFYKETDIGWLRTRPVPMLWGAAQYLETDHLIWHYRQRDHAAVTEIAGQMDALYVLLQQDYGLARPQQEDKLVIDVQIDYAPKLMSSYHSPVQTLATQPQSSLPFLMSVPSSVSHHSIDVPSPATYLAPATETDAEVLVQTVALALLKNAWEQATAQHGIEQTWPVMNGVRLWQLWDMEYSLSEWEGDVVQWIYGDGGIEPAGSEITLPDRYHELCVAHTLRMIEPFYIGIPLYCGREDSDSTLNNALLANLRDASLDGLEGVSPYNPDRRAIRLGTPFMMYTVIDYTVTAYGRERLPILVAALGQYDSWETLAPAVYGVSLDEFEQGWRQHVAGLAQ